MKAEMRFDERTVSTIVHAIYKATAVDIPMAYSENRRATNNCFAAMRVDVINDNLETMLSYDGVKVHHFRRHGWEVCMVLNYHTDTAYFVFSERNLLTIPRKKDRTWPHYLQTLLHKFHEDYEPRVIQESFLPHVDPFDDETYDADAEMILRDVIDNLDAWHLYVISYDRTGNDVTSATLYFYTSDFQEIDKRDLGKYIIPTYASANKPVVDVAPTSSEEETAETLIKLKPKARPASEADDAPKVKPNEYNDVG